MGWFRRKPRLSAWLYNAIVDEALRESGYVCSSDGCGEVAIHVDVQPSVDTSGEPFYSARALCLLHHYEVTRRDNGRG